MVFGKEKKNLHYLYLYWCYYPHRSRDSVSPVCFFCMFYRPRTKSPPSISKHLQEVSSTVLFLSVWRQHCHQPPTDLAKDASTAVSGQWQSNFWELRCILCINLFPSRTQLSSLSALFFYIFIFFNVFEVYVLFLTYWKINWNKIFISLLKYKFMPN